MILCALDPVSAFFHAIWNLLAKRAGSEASGPAFVWLSDSLSTRF
jgi:hypothetical protein